MRLVSDEQSAILKFAIGTQELDVEELHLIQEEGRKHGDLLLLDCVDSDDELTEAGEWFLNTASTAISSKVLLSIKWSAQNFEFDYWFRLSDSYFRIDMFLQMLLAGLIPGKKAVIGRILSAQVFDMQQVYPSSVGYGLTSDICAFVSANTDVLLKNAPEGYVVSRWLYAVGAKFVDIANWIKADSSGCSPDTLLATGLSEASWSAIHDNGTLPCI